MIDIVPTFAQTAQTSPTAPSVTVTTDKPSYTLGDTIVISGQVAAVVPQTPLTIQILDSKNNLIQVAQIDVSSDGKFTKSLDAFGPLWVSSGTFTIKVQYGLPNVTAQTTFSFQSSVTPISNMFQVKDPNSQQTFDVNYTINGGTVKDMTIDPQQLSLIVSINSTQDGSLQLRIPRTLVDSRTDAAQDIPFLALIGGAEVKVQDNNSDNYYRTVTIQFLQGDQQIQIIGTQIVPEFGSTTTIALLISVVSFVLISKKRLVHFPSR
ncbi:MAG: PEFG-CTERM sorting domain-containing protein [Nitrosotalea sp.]